MRRGTATLLFGCHQLVLHPLYITRAWRRLYGRPGLTDLVAIAIHDWGYLGLRDVDGAEGFYHAHRMGRVLGALGLRKLAREVEGHSRSWADRIGIPRSRLFAADKLGTALMPSRLWLRLARATGEITEYTGRADNPRWMVARPDVWHALVYRQAALAAFGVV